MALTKRLVLFILFLNLVRAQDDAEEADGGDGAGTVRVNAPIGPILGKKQKSFFAFKGIPYAEAPVGRLRFKDPMPKRRWTSPLNATEFGASCPQSDFFGDPKGVKGEEDCLYLNVFTPQLPAAGRRDSGVQPPESLLAVMVFVHGGGFSIGTGNRDPTPLLAKDVVVVSMNYRLGPLGFFTLESPVASGNQGLKDQLEAFRWVRRNIAFFGGDPDRVTIFGVSAGGMSVHLHQISPQGAGLYRGIIAQSGSALWNGADATTGRTESSSRRLAEHFGCDNKYDPNSVVRCLEKVNATELVKAVQNSMNLTEDLEKSLAGKPEYAFTPVLDGAYSPNPFLPVHPFTALELGQQKDLPFITGVAENEGSFFAAYLWDQLDAYNANFSYFGPKSIFLTAYSDITDHERLVANVTRQFYFGKRNISQEVKEELLDYFSDITFVSPGIKGLRLMRKSQSQPVYFYVLSQKPATPLVDLIGTIKNDEDFGVGHGDDLPFFFKDIFGPPKEGEEPSEEIDATSEALTTLWTNFAKHKDPTPFQTSNDDLPFWIPFGEEENFLDIKATPEMKKDDIFQERMHFWEKMFWEDFKAGLSPLTSAPPSPPSPPPPPPPPQPPVGLRLAPTVQLLPNKAIAIPYAQNFYRPVLHSPSIRN